MKVLHILTDSNIGGAGYYLLSLLKSYDRDRFQIAVVLPEGSRLRSLVQALDVPVSELPHMADRSFSLKATCSLYWLIREIKPDIVHTHASFSGRLAAKMLRLPLIYTRHYCLSAGKRQSMNFINNLFGDRVIATAPEVATGLIESGTKPERITTILNGSPPLKKLSDEEKAAVRARYGIASDDFVISQVARLEPVKGHMHSLDAAKLLAKDPKIVLLLAGDGALDGHLRKRIKDEKINNVIMTGFVKAVEEIHNISDLQINASYTETSCLALIEGMSLGIPAVASGGGGNPDVIKHGERGLIVPIGNALALAEAVLEIKNDIALYRRFSAGALDAYNKYFRAEIMARQVEALYQEVMDENRKQGS